MIRELILTSGDFASTHWFPNDTPPMLTPPKGTSVETIRDASKVDLFTISPVSVAEAKQRLSEGDSCVVATDASGLAAAMWCSERKRYIKWIGCNIQPPPGHVHFYNAWVRPDARGLNLQWVMAAAACANVVALGRQKICAGVERREFPPFARKYAAIGLGVITPYKSVWALRAFGVSAVISTRPPPSLNKASRKAGAIFARHARSD
jgi:hypothetical protein